MIKAVLFDMDGTLIDTERYFRVFWPKAMAEFGFTMSDEQALQMRSLGRPFAPAKLKEWFGETVDYPTIRARRTKMMEAEFAKDGLQLKAGAEEILEELQRRGIPAYVVTASPIERTERYLTQVGIRKYFPRIISATEVKQGKPAPDVYEYACREIGLEPSECAAVEDSPNGVLSAYRAGCKVIMVPDQSDAEEMREYLYAVAPTLKEIGELL
ncbi:MAG: HAD family phosphatase [Lachnospiraceae bacterium]|nr:HAD family phosphatase [Lachnospiraceae bacterium]